MLSRQLCRGQKVSCRHCAGWWKEAVTSLANELHRWVCIFCCCLFFSTLLPEKYSNFPEAIVLKVFLLTDMDIRKQPTATAGGKSEAVKVRRFKEWLVLAKRTREESHWGSLRLINGTSDHMLSQKQEKAICKNISGEWSSRAKIIFCEGKFHVLTISRKTGTSGSSRCTHLFRMSIVCYTAII